MYKMHSWRRDTNHALFHVRAFTEARDLSEIELAGGLYSVIQNVWSNFDYRIRDSMQIEIIKPAVKLAQKVRQHQGDILAQLTK